MTHRERAERCCESIWNSYTTLNIIIVGAWRGDHEYGMDPDRDYFISKSMMWGQATDHNEYIVPGGLDRRRSSIEKCLDTSVRSLARLKYLLDIDPAIRVRDSFGARMFDELGSTRSEEFFQKLIRDATTS